MKNSFEVINNVILSLVRMLIELAPMESLLYSSLYLPFKVFGMIGDLAKYFSYLFCFTFPWVCNLWKSFDLNWKTNPVQFS